MKRTALVVLGLIVMAALCSGCVVAESKYLKKVNEADELTGRATALAAENDDLKNRIKTLAEQREDFRLKVSVLETENARLKDNLAEATRKTSEVEKESNTYQRLLGEMKDEIDKGQITIRELKGKLTMDVVDKILFDSGEAKVKKEGLKVLDRVADILKNVDDKNIRIEGHTDNVKIIGRLALVYPTNWELSAARAINVSRYLQEKGIAPAVLSATAFGEYQPVADNATAEGRAKNRRIAIILQPKD